MNAFLENGILSALSVSWLSGGVFISRVMYTLLPSGLDCPSPRPLPPSPEDQRKHSGYTEISELLHTLKILSLLGSILCSRSYHY